MHETAVLLNIFVETRIFFSGFFENRQYLFKIEMFCNIINVFHVTFDKFNAPLPNINLI